MLGTINPSFVFIAMDMLCELWYTMVLFSISSRALSTGNSESAIDVALMKIGISVKRSFASAPSCVTMCRRSAIAPSILTSSASPKCGISSDAAIDFSMPRRKPRIGSTVFSALPFAGSAWRVDSCSGTSLADLVGGSCTWLSTSSSSTRPSPPLFGVGCRRYAEKGGVHAA
ncbi:unnamed protein product [Chondrus crispus]|uniref:Uncharacterized protein n=1 Tax=Chondrus crispus TaxID=2769 RepID=R7QH37_CHOCR|nr:unnamed protein product [Chondrus crispus]CDF37837.1 unnamed protein product [Chondrus crispus]|eukprot:XP_005717708.1 unnamed protein product [Chondrus crispus]